jgi:hypothetical protein
MGIRLSFGILFFFFGSVTGTAHMAVHQWNCGSHNM